MNILPNSDIQGVNNRIYLNNPELKDGKSGTNLFYSSPYSKQYYFIMRGYEVIANGVMNGYLENGEYLYRFDFVNFIKIINQEEPVFYRLDNGSYKFTGNNSIDLYMYMSNTELLQTNISNERLIVLPNGSVVLNSATYTYLDIVSANHCFTSFIDAGDTIYDQEGYELQYRRETVVVGQKGSYLPITVYRNNILIYMFKDAEGNIIYQSSPLQRGPDISMPGLNDGYILTESDGYMLSEINSLISLEGGMDTVLSFKNGYVVYMILIPENATSISYYIYSNGGSSSMNIYGYNLIANSQFLKFDSQPNTQDSILMKDEGEWYYKAIPTTGNRVVIDGANYNTIAGQMYSSGLWVRSNIATTASISRQANMLDSERVFNLVANVWTYIYTNAVIGNGC